MNNKIKHRSSLNKLPESYKLVRPPGNGIALSDVYTTSVLDSKPAFCSSFRTNPTPTKNYEHCNLLTIIIILHYTNIVSVERFIVVIFYMNFKCSKNLRIVVSSLFLK